MSKFPPLEKWSPKELVKTYSNCFSPDSEHIFKQFPQIKQALYRLGTNLDMKECWDKLLFKKEFLPKQEYASVWMVSQIYLMLVDVFMRSDGVMTPQFKKKEIKKIEELVNKLIIATHNSDEALKESFFTVHTKLSESIIKKYPDRSRNLGFEVAPISSWSFISGIRDVVKTEKKSESLEHFEWDSWSEDKKMAWVLSQIDGMNLTSILHVYLNQLKEIPDTYATEYIASKRATVTKKLFEIVYKSYGDYMPECVTPMVNAILDLELGIEDITPYKPKEKNS
jgi:hypothetical protein